MTLDISVPFKRPSSISFVRYFFGTRMRIPAAIDLTLTKGESVPDTERVVGEKYLTNTGHVCTVLSKDRVFMGHTSFVKYANGAIRQFVFSDPLFEIN